MKNLSFPFSLEPIESYSYEITQTDLLNIVVNGKSHFFSLDSLIELKKIFVNNVDVGHIINRGYNYYVTHKKLERGNHSNFINENFIISVLGIDTTDVNYKGVCYNMNDGAIIVENVDSALNQKYHIHDFFFNHCKRWTDNLDSNYDVTYNMGYNVGYNLGSYYNVSVLLDGESDYEFYHDPFDLIGYLNLAYNYIYCKVS